MNSSCSIGEGDGQGLEDPGLEAYDLDFLDWEPQGIPTPPDDAADLSDLPILNASEEDFYFNSLPPLLPFEDAPFGNDEEQQQHFHDSALLGFGDDTTTAQHFHDDLLDFSESSEASRVSVSQNSGSEYQQFEAVAAADAAAAAAIGIGGGAGTASHCSDESTVSFSRSKQGRSRTDHAKVRKQPESPPTQAASSAGSQRGPTERMMEISLNELSQYFHMPITQASKELKVGLTVLKKRCREFGIPRWPHRKLKSLESLIQNIQELSKNSGDRKNFMDAVRELEKQKKSMEESPGIELSERTKRLRQACFKQSYKQRRQALAHVDLDTDDK